MASPSRLSLYVRVRQAVDRDLLRHRKPVFVFLGFLPLLLSVLTYDHVARIGRDVAMAMCIVAFSTSVSWLGFLVWRAWVMAKRVGFHQSGEELNHRGRRERGETRR
jgi:hypothetical protein